MKTFRQSGQALISNPGDHARCDWCFKWIDESKRKNSRYCNRSCKELGMRYKPGSKFYQFTILGPFSKVKFDALVRQAQLKGLNIRASRTGGM